LFESSILEGVGQISHYSYGYGMPDTRVSWDYIYIPGACEKGQRLWSYSSVEQNEVAQFNIYPNPSTSFVHVKGLPEISHAILIGTNGTTFTCDVQDQTLLLPEVSNGIYMLQISGPNFHRVKHIHVLRD
jgi:hypothetical protein